MAETAAHLVDRVLPESPRAPVGAVAALRASLSLRLRRAPHEKRGPEPLPPHPVRFAAPPRAPTVGRAPRALRCRDLRAALRVRRGEPEPPLPLPGARRGLRGLGRWTHSLPSPPAPRRRRGGPRRRRHGPAPRTAPGGTRARTRRRSHGIRPARPRRSPARDARRSLAPGPRRHRASRRAAPPAPRGSGRARRARVLRRRAGAALRERGRLESSCRRRRSRPRSQASRAPRPLRGSATARPSGSRSSTMDACVTA